jgi:hypothetical protein
MIGGIRSVHLTKPSEVRGRIEELLRRSIELRVEAELNEKAKALLNAAIRRRMEEVRRTEKWRGTQDHEEMPRREPRTEQPRHRPRQ